MPLFFLWSVRYRTPKRVRADFLGLRRATRYKVCGGACLCLFSGACPTGRLSVVYVRTFSDCGAGGVSQHVAMRDCGERPDTGVPVHAFAFSLERALPDA